MVHDGAASSAVTMLLEPGRRWICAESSSKAVAISPPFSSADVLSIEAVVQCVMRTASKGASMRMRLIAVLAVLTASFALGGCFHHNQAVIVEPLPPLK